MTRTTERIVVRREADGWTVQRLLHVACGVSHSVARGLLASGGVRLNGRPVESPAARVQVGDVLEVGRDPSARYRAPRRKSETHGYRVVHEEDAFLVVDKRPGLITVPSSHHRGESLVELAEQDYRRRGFRRARVLAIHRIDRFTSGLVVVARAGSAQAALRAQFASGSPERTYLAIVEGRVSRDEGRLVHQLAEHPRSLKVHAVEHAAAGRRASCSFKVRERLADATLVEVRLETGRKNQIRVQFAAEGHPVLGDVSYGRASDRIDRPALHAWKLAFDHPTSGRRVRFEAPLPSDFRKLLARLRRESP